MADRWRKIGESTGFADEPVELWMLFRRERPFPIIAFELRGHIKRGRARLTIRDVGTGNSARLIKKAQAEGAPRRLRLRIPPEMRKRARMEVDPDGGPRRRPAYLRVFLRFQRMRPSWR